jgi:hypothetical protein
MILIKNNLGPPLVESERCQDPVSYDANQMLDRFLYANLAYLFFKLGTSDHARTLSLASSSHGFLSCFLC